MSRSAALNPNKFFIGIDANVKPLVKPSIKVTRKPHKGGIQNVLFVQASAEEMPDELYGVANKIHIHFPWGSLLKAVVEGNDNVLRSFDRIAAPGCLLEIMVGLDPDRDRSEIERLGLPELDDSYLDSSLIPKYEAANFEIIESCELGPERWSMIETTWAKKLHGNGRRKIRFLLFRKPFGFASQRA